MELNKLDKYIKEQLLSREIQPSEMAWSKLDAMLTADQKPRRRFVWMYIAASIIGFLLIGTIYFSQSTTGLNNQKNEVVLDNIIVYDPNAADSTMIKAKDQQREMSRNNVASTNSSTKRIISTIIKLPVNKSLSTQNDKVEVSIINQKTQKNSIYLQSIAVSVDELLAAVENPSNKEMKLQQNQVVHVNVNNLLAEVDGELELSFREKIINKVSKNFQTVKVALSNRNLE